MRLITRKIYRAFPELDRFSDEQCRRFVAAAHASATRLALRGGVSVAVGLGLGFVLLVGATRLAQELSDRWRLSDPWYWLFWGGLLSLALLLAFIPALVLADLLLRLSLRSLLRRCGTCPQCRYTLLGMRVPSNLIVICPECGHGLKVEPALGELATDDAGAQVYRPEIVREDEAWMVIRKRRRVRILKWAGASVAVLLIVIGGVCGVLLRFVHTQAVAARAAMEPASRVREILAAARGSGDDERSEAEWDRFVALLFEPMAVVERLNATAGMTNTGVPVSFDASVLRDASSQSRRGDWSSASPELEAARRRLALDVLDTCRAEGVFERLKGLKAIDAPARRMMQKNIASSAFFSYEHRQFAGGFQLLEVEKARMIVAAQAHDLDEYLASVDEVLWCADHFARQATVYEHGMASRLRAGIASSIIEDAPMFPNTQWHAEIQGVLASHDGRSPFATALRVSQVEARNYVHWFFGDADQVRDATLGIGQYRQGALFGLPGGKRMVVGTHRGNVERIDAIYGYWIEQAGKPCSQQSVSPPSDHGLSLVQNYLAFLGQMVKQMCQTQFEYRVCMVTLAVERFRRENGRLPKKDEMKLLGIPAEFLLDPTNELPFGVRAKTEPKPGLLLFDVVGGGTGLEDHEDGK